MGGRQGERARCLEFWIPIQGRRWEEEPELEVIPPSNTPFPWSYFWAPTHTTPFLILVGSLTTWDSWLWTTLISTSEGITSLPILPKDSLRCTGLFLDAMLPPSKPAVGIPFYLVMHQMLTNAVPKLMASKRSIRLWHLLSQEEKKLWLKTKDIWCREKKLLISAKISVRRLHTKDAQRKMEQNAIH